MKKRKRDCKNNRTQITEDAVYEVIKLRDKTKIHKPESWQNIANKMPYKLSSLKKA